MKTLSILIILILNFCACHAQSNQADSLKLKFSSYRENYLQEKLYLHTDNNFYITGENVWIKIYSVDGTTHKPLGLSKVAYVEFLNANKQPVVQQKIEMANGFGNASVYLPASLESGNYILRAYTQWMKNYSPDFFYHKNITVVNTFKKLDQTKPKEIASNLTLNFFPEGGNLVYDLESKIAFDVRDHKGQGIPGRGWILSGVSQDTVARFESDVTGLGVFNFLPKKHADYKVKFLSEEGKEALTSLPAIFDSGITLSLNSTERELEVVIQSTRNSNELVYLFAHTRNAIASVEARKLNNGKTVFSIDKSMLLEGVSHITLFDENLKPLCERLWFKPVTSVLDIKLEHASQFITRGKVDLQVNATKERVDPAPANLSIAVYKVDSLSTLQSQGLPEYLWIHSDLKLQVDDPKIFFSTDQKSQERVDLLMLTQGWRRFKWENVLDKQVAINFLPEVLGHHISGTVTNAAGQINPGAVVFLSAPGKTVLLGAQRSDTKGRVSFELPDLIGPRRIIVQSDSLHDFGFTLDTPFSTAYADLALSDFYLSRATKRSLLDRSLSMQVRTTYNRNDAKLNPIATNDTIPFYGRPDDTYHLDDYTRFPLVEEVLREYVPKVRVRKRRDGFHFVLLDIQNQVFFENDPLVIVDGVPTSADRVLEMNPLSIKRLDVVGRKYFLGPATRDGIVSFVTYNGDLSTFKLDPKAFSINYEGLARHAEFYAPSYNSVKDVQSTLPDNRHLLYWNPNVTTHLGKWSGSFFTSDVPGNYVIIAEGLSVDGFAGRKMSYFTVTERKNP